VGVTTGSKIIFCEGKKASLDYLLLNRLLNKVNESNVIVPAGGKFSFPTFAQGYFYPDEVKTQQYIIFRDRDFDGVHSKNLD
jgi:hypothetical protein